MDLKDLLSYKMSRSNIKVHVQTLHIQTEANIALNGTLYQQVPSHHDENPSHSPDLIIMCHGLTGDQNEWGRFPKAAEEMCKHRWDVLTFDFAGSGKNARIPITLTAQVRNLENVYNWGKTQGYLRISVIGLSFGGLTAAIANMPDRLTTIFWAPAFFMRKVLGLRASITRLLFLFRKRPISVSSKGNPDILLDRSFLSSIQTYPIKEILQNFQESCLVLQGGSDITVKPQWTRKAFHELPHTDQQVYLEIPGATHVFNGSHLDQFIAESIKWLAKYHPKGNSEKFEKK